MTIPKMLQNGEGNWSLWVKVIALVLTIGSIVFAAGGTFVTVKDTNKQVEAIKNDITNRSSETNELHRDHEKRIQNLEKEQVRHEEIDKQVLETMNDVKSELKRHK